MSDTSTRMSIGEHFGELRRRLVIILVVLLVATIVLYFFTPNLIQFLIAPISQYLPGAQVAELNVLDPLSGFTLRVKIAFEAAIIATCPVWIWHMFAFFLPALKPNERKWIIPTFFIGLVLFLGGEVFCYFVILDPAFGWLLEQASAFGTVFPNAQSFINLILMFELSFGIAFELPLVVFYLLVFRIISYKKLRSSWRVIYIVMMILCAAITPDGSPVGMMLLFGAMISLYEISSAAARVVLRKRINKQTANDQDIQNLDEEV